LCHGIKYKIYRGIDINGTWAQEIKQNENDKEVLTLNLVQKGHTLKGTLSIFQDHQGSMPGEIIFSATGELLDGNILLSMKAKDKRQQGIATILAKCNGGGIKLDGSLSFINAYQDNIHTINISLQRSL